MLWIAEHPSLNIFYPHLFSLWVLHSLMMFKLMVWLWVLSLLSCGINFIVSVKQFVQLTNGGRVTHICVNKLTIIVSDNGLSPGRHQAFIWTNAGILLNGPLGTKFSEILIGIQTFSFKNLHLKTPSAKLRLFCLGLSELTTRNMYTVCVLLSFVLTM